MDEKTIVLPDTTIHSLESAIEITRKLTSTLRHLNETFEKYDFIRQRYSIWN